MFDVLRKANVDNLSPTSKNTQERNHMLTVTFINRNPVALVSCRFGLSRECRTINIGAALLFPVAGCEFVDD